MKTGLTVTALSLGMVALAGCAGHSVTAGTEPTPTPYTAQITGNYSLCDTLLPSGTSATLQGLGASNLDDAYEQRTLENEPYAAEVGGIPIARLVHRDGVICSWGPPDWDELDEGPTLVIGYGRITSADAVTEQAALADAGSQISAARFSNDQGHPGQYVFGDGYWLFVASSDSAGSTLFGTSLDASGFADAVIANAPAF